MSRIFYLFLLGIPTCESQLFGRMESYYKYTWYRMTILHISDTHAKHSQLRGLPLADVLVHSGDFTENGTEEEAIDFLEWFTELPHKYKILIAGNHDTCMRGEKIEGLPENCHYLDCSSVNIEGITFYGVPLFMQDIKEKTLDQKYVDIPQDTDVLITHQPPLGILDGDEADRFGNAALMCKVIELRPRIHLFGHAHVDYGIQAGLSTTFSNASISCSKCTGIRNGNKITF